MASSFVGEITLQAAVPDDSVDPEQGQEEDEGRFSISTIHRSKGLEWSDVYSPFFNEGLMNH